MGEVESLTLSYDGMVLLSGYQNGKVISWNVGRRKYASTVADYTHPVTNISMLPVDGLPHTSLDLSRISQTVIKPRYEQALSESSVNPGAVPADYAFQTRILSSSASANGTKKTDQFSEALTHAFFPQSMMEEGLAELSSLSQPGNTTTNTFTQAVPTTTQDTEDAALKNAQISALEEELAALKKKSTVSETARQSTTDEVTRLRSNLNHLQDYANGLHQKQEQTQREKINRQARKEKREAKKREAWFAAEKKGRNGDAAVQKMDVDGGALTSDTDEQSDD
ncbi:Pre-rRNA-processing protein ipi3 [Elasticomyces elasticus]|nr:Pre-rRNA-processing protein ipi3 [Elasticomyces elasticus]